MFRKKKRLLGIIALLVLVGSVSWCYRREIRGYYHAWRWQQVDGEIAAYHAAQIAQLDESGWPALRWLLHTQTRNVQGKLTDVTTQWWQQLRQTGRMPAMLRHLARDWAALSEAAQACLLEALADVVISLSSDVSHSTLVGSAADVCDTDDSKPSPRTTDLVSSLRSFLVQVQPLDHRSGRLAIVRLTHWVASFDHLYSSSSGGNLVTQSSAALENPELISWWRWCRDLAELALTDTRTEVRVEAVRLAALPQLAMTEKLARRLLEPPGETSAEVRALLLVAIGDPDCEDVAPSEALARFLHDASNEVQTTCEQVLRARGLTPRRIQLARLWTDPDPLVRAQVPSLLYEDAELDTVAWLERLSRDASPVVRAAAIRAAVEHAEVRFAARLSELACEDVSPTVRQLASYYERALLSRR